MEEENDCKLYHATPRRNVESILKNGLVPKGSFIFLSEDPESRFVEGLAVFEVDVKGIGLEMHTYLPRLDEVVVCGKIEPSRLKLLENY